MPRYHITYFYLASGMEGHADREDYGTVEANSAQEAKEKAAHLCHPDASKIDIIWIVSCLTAKKI